MEALAAVLGLSKARLQPGETIFINGDDGSIGTAVLEIARASGGRVIVTAGDEQKARWCQQLGADLIINYKTQDVNQAVKAFVPQGVNVYWDATRHFDAEKAFEVTAQRGRIIVMAGLSQKTILPVGPFYTHSYTMYGFTATDATPEELGHYAEQINGWLEKGILKGRIAQKLSLSLSRRRPIISTSRRASLENWCSHRNGIERSMVS